VTRRGCVIDLRVGGFLLTVLVMMIALDVLGLGLPWYITLWPLWVWVAIAVGKSIVLTRDDN
jgi:hypothetical protein